MVDSKYGIAYSEVLEILKYIPVEDYNKIPKTKIELFETNANNDYKFTYEPNKTLEEQNVSNITKGIIILLFRDYWANENQKKKIIAKQNYDRMRLEEEKKARYNTDIFQNINNLKQEQNIDENISTSEVAMVEYKESILRRFINKIKSIFHKNS